MKVNLFSEVSGVKGAITSNEKVSSCLKSRILVSLVFLNYSLVPILKG